MESVYTPLRMAKEIYAMQNGGKKKRGRKPVFSANQFYPWSVEMQVKDLVSSMLLENGKRLKEAALLGYQADGLEDVNGTDIFIPSDLTEKSEKIFRDVESFSSRKLDEFAEKTVGRTLGYIPNQAKIREDFVNNFVANCKSAAENQKKDIANAVYAHRMFPDGKKGSLSKEINDINKKYTKGKANFIARNETGNLNAAIQHSQIEGAGFEMYTWMCMPDGVTRDTHKALNGMVCRWDKPDLYSDDGGKTWQKRTGSMFIGEPGQDFNCRCTAVPFDPELDEEYSVKEIPEEKPEEKEPTPLEQAMEETKAAEEKVHELEGEIHALATREENTRAAAFALEVDNPKSKKDAIRRIVQDMSERYDIPEKELNVPILNEIRTIYLKLVQLTGIGKFERIAKRNVIGEPIVFETPNTLKMHTDEIAEIFTKPSGFFKRNVTEYVERGEIRYFAVDSVKNVKKYVVAHEVGHKLYFESKLPDKENRLKEIYFRTVNDKSIEKISEYARMSAEKGNYDEFFAEIFAMWSRKDVNLLGYLSDFVEEVIK